MKTKSLILCLLLIGSIIKSEEKVIVRTSLGYIEGTTSISSKGDEFFSFLGVPYAEPPVKNFRFKDPRPKKKWKEILKAQEDGKMCPQPGVLVNRTDISEDCLVLNIHTRAIKGKKPVLFFIHGGANIFGSGHSKLQAGPHYLLNHDVVLVTSNHRFGPFGFGSTNDRFMTGNFGSKDIIMALKLVSKNIRYFGGDPDKVTIMGHGAGATTVSLLMISPMSKGLFHRVIAMSGSPLSYVTHETTKWTEKLAMETGCGAKNSKQVIKCLEKLSWEEIVDTTSSWEKPPPGVFKLKWNSIVEKDFGQQMFLPNAIDDYYDRGDFMKVPFMIGIVSNEFDYVGQQFMQHPRLVQEINENPEEYFPDVFNYPTQNYNNSNEVTRAIREVYMNNEDLVNETSTEFGTCFTDSLIKYPTERLVNAIRKTSDIFVYEFERKGSFTRTGADANFGVVHADDQQYLFTSAWRPTFTLLDEEHETVDLMTSVIVNFASKGDPNFGQEPLWTPSNSSALTVFHLGENFSINSELISEEKYKVWDKLTNKRISFQN